MAQSRGRRPGTSTTRHDIVEAAKHQFAAVGYPGATMRSIARQAGVDPRLVSHYFGSKQELFLAVFELPVVPDTDHLDAMRQAVDQGAPLGELFVRRLLTLLRTDDFSQAATGLLRAAATEPEVAAMCRQYLLENVLQPIISRFAPDANPLRAALASTQITGIVMGLLVVGLQPLTERSDDELARAYGPTFDRYLRGDIG